MTRLAHSATLIAATLVYPSVQAQVIVTPKAGNQLIVTASASMNLSSGLYTYTYSFTNKPSSVQSAWFIVLELAGDAATKITNARAPKGWQVLPAGNSPGLAWAATEIDEIPANFVDDGSVPPSPFQIVPGQTLTGFSFQSPSPPTAVKFYAQGFTPMPQAYDVADLAGAGYTFPDYTEDSNIGVTQGPAPTNPTIQPSGAEFFSFTGLTNNAVVKPPVTVGVEFNTTSVAINTASLHVELNGTDITSAFRKNSQGSLSATLGSTIPLQTGANILEAVISGTANGAAQSSYDMNRVKFYVNSTRPLDLNGDGVVNCADLAIVKASFGKSVGQTGFDPRADVNGDGVVNILDLSAVAHALPAGTICH